MSSKWERFKKYIKKSWADYQKSLRIQRNGYDPHYYITRCRELENEVTRLRKKCESLASEVDQHKSKTNDSDVDYDEYMFYKRVHDDVSNLHRLFPVELRKMWSGNEVYTWLRNAQQELLKKG